MLCWRQMSFQRIKTRNLWKSARVISSFNSATRLEEGFPFCFYKNILLISVDSGVLIPVEILNKA